MFAYPASHHHLDVSLEDQRLCKATHSASVLALHTGRQRTNSNRPSIFRGQAQIPSLLPTLSSLNLMSIMRVDERVDGVLSPEVWPLKPVLNLVDQCVRWGPGVLYYLSPRVCPFYYHTLLPQCTYEVQQQCGRIDRGDFADGYRFVGIGRRFGTVGLRILTIG
jgi:hypothetical protein